MHAGNGTSPVWSILHQLYGFAAVLDNAIQQLCNVSIARESDDAEFRTFCTTTILASNQKHQKRRQFTTKQKSSLNSIITSVDRHGCARCAAHTNSLRLLHSRLGDDGLQFILSQSSLFVPVGKNYMQISGMPIYNVMGFTYTPLLANRRAVKRKRPLERKRRHQDAVLQGQDNGPPPVKKSKLRDVVQHTVKVDPKAGNTATTMRKGKRFRVQGQSVCTTNRRGKGHYTRRGKRVASRLRRQANGSISSLCPSEK
jgi:hypothetical protein